MKYNYIDIIIVSNRNKKMGWAEYTFLGVGYKYDSDKDMIKGLKRLKKIVYDEEADSDTKIDGSI